MKKLIPQIHCGILEKTTLISFCISVMVWLLSKNFIIYVLLIILLIVKLIKTYKYIKKYENRIRIDKNILFYEKNLYIKRSMIADIQLIILSLIIFAVSNLKINFDKISLAVYIIFTVLSYVCYVCKNSYLKSLPIIISTPISLVFFMFFIILLFLLLDKIIFFIDDYLHLSVSYTTTNSISPDLIGSTLLMISAMEKNISYWIYSIVIFCILNFLYIIYTPKYHFKAIKKSYNIITLFASLIALIAILASPFLSKKLINIVQTSPELLDNNTSAIDYFKNFSETNMRNIITLILIPYSIGLIICNAFINFRINRANEKKDKMAKKLLTETNEKLIEEEKIEFLINGGKSVELDYIDQIRINSCKS